MPAAILGTVLALVVLAIVTDVRAGRIPNAVTAPAALAGFALNGLYFGARGLCDSAAGLVVVVALLVAPFALGGIGGGDVKLMGAVGALLGPRAGLVALAAGTTLGGAVVAVHLARCGRLREKLVALGRMTAAAALCGSVAPLRANAAGSDAVALPYSVPLGLGTLAAVCALGVAG
jgi:prepilin peptidase CpaA